MRILRYVREDAYYKKESLISSTHLKRIYEDWIKQIARCSGLPAEFIPLFFDTFSVTCDEMWYLADNVMSDRSCGHNTFSVDYFPNDTFPGLDVHRVNQYKGNPYQVDRHGCRPVIIYLRLVILDIDYIEVKVIKYRASDQFKYPVKTDSYPVVQCEGTTFNEAIEEAAKFMRQINCLEILPSKKDHVSQHREGCRGDKFESHHFGLQPNQDGGGSGSTKSRQTSRNLALPRQIPR